MLQAHAWQPFDKCAALVTIQNETSEAVLCIGDNITTLVSTRAEEPDRYFGAFGCEVAGTSRMIFMLAGEGVRLTKLTYQPHVGTAGQEFLNRSKVQTSNEFLFAERRAGIRRRRTGAAPEPQRPHVVKCLARGGHAAAAVRLRRAHARQRARGDADDRGPRAAAVLRPLARRAGREAVVLSANARYR
jgi:hypothetical protein